MIYLNTDNPVYGGFSSAVNTKFWSVGVARNAHTEVGIVHSYYYGTTFTDELVMVRIAQSRHDSGYVNGEVVAGYLPSKRIKAYHQNGWWSSVEKVYHNAHVVSRIQGTQEELVWADFAIENTKT